MAYIYFYSESSKGSVPNSTITCYRDNDVTNPIIANTSSSSATGYYLSTNFIPWSYSIPSGWTYASMMYSLDDGTNWYTYDINNPQWIDNFSSSAVIKVKMYVLPPDDTVRVYKNDGGSSYQTCTIGTGDWRLSDYTAPTQSHYTLTGISIQYNSTTVAAFSTTGACVRNASIGSINYISEYQWVYTGTDTVRAYCIWDPETVRLYFEPNGGSGTKSSQAYQYGVAQRIDNTVMFNPPTGHTQDGWATSSGGAKVYELSASLTLYGNTTIYAHYSPKNYPISFDKQGGSGGTDSTYAMYSYDMPNISVPSRSGYRFIGYYTEMNGAGTKYYNNDGTSANKWYRDVTGTTTLYAYWELITYTITAVVGTGGSYVKFYTSSHYTTEITSAAANTTVYFKASSLNNYVIDSRTFTNVSSVTGTAGGVGATSEEGYFTMQSANATITYNFHRTNVAVYFNANGGSGTMQTQNMQYNTPTPLSPNTFTKEHATFNGWNTNSGGTGTQYSDGQTVTLTTDTDLYAMWTGDAQHTLTITQPTNGSISPSGPFQLYTGDTQALTATANEGYVLETWTNTSGELTSITSANTSFIMGSSDAVVSCTFREQETPTQYSVTIVCIGSGWCTTTSNYASPNTTVTLTKGASSGWAFSRYVARDGSTVISNDSFTMPEHDVVVFAIFESTSIYNPSLTSLSIVQRYKLLIDNGKSQIVVTRSPTRNIWFNELEYAKEINKCTTSKVTLYFPNDDTSNIIDVGTHIVILYNDYPVYYGYVTSFSQVNNESYYSSPLSNGIVLNVSFEDIIREYNYMTTSSDNIYTGQVGYIARNIILPRNNGIISDDSDLKMSFNPNGNSRMLSITNLSNLSGWRYRTQPRVLIAYNGKMLVDQYFIGFSERLSEYDSKVVALLKYTNRKGNVEYAAVRFLGEYNGVVTENSHTYYTYNVHQDLRSRIQFIGTSRELYATVVVLDRYQIDFSRSYYQDQSIVKPDRSLPTVNKRAWSNNNTAQNVSNTVTTNTNYGSVCASSVSGYGGMKSCTIPLITKHNKDYSVDRTCRIINSMDYDVYRYNITQTDITIEVPSQHTGILGMYANGLYLWVSTSGSTTSQYKAVYISRAELMDTTQTSIKSIGQNDYTVPYLIQIRFIKPAVLPDPDTCVYTRIVGTDNNPVIINNVFSGYTSSDTCEYYTDGQFEVGDEIYIGGEHTVVTYVDPQLPGHIGVSRRFLTNPSEIIYGHMNGILVTSVPQGGFEEESPYAKYPDKILSITTQTNLSYMEVERLASVYAQYGSNFDVNGSCVIPLQNYIKSEQNHGLVTLPEVGDHIALYNSDYTESNSIMDYELLSYKIQCDYATVTITYGTTSKTMNDFVYSLYKNSNTNIIRG